MEKLVQRLREEGFRGEGMFQVEAVGVEFRDAAGRDDDAGGVGELDQVEGGQEGGAGGGSQAVVGGRGDGEEVDFGGGGGGGDGAAWLGAAGGDGDCEEGCHFCEVV